MIIDELLRKWFGLTPLPCNTCEVLRSMLDESNRERKDLLHNLLSRDKAEPPQPEKEEYKSIQPAFVPWRVRQQMLEAEDRKRAQLTKDKAQEISDLEKELGVASEK